MTSSTGISSLSPADQYKLKTLLARSMPIQSIELLRTTQHDAPNVWTQGPQAGPAAGQGVLWVGGFRIGDDSPASPSGHPGIRY